MEIKPQNYGEMKISTFSIILTEIVMILGPQLDPEFHDYRLPVTHLFELTYHLFCLTVTIRGQRQYSKCDQIRFFVYSRFDQLERLLE